MKKQYGLTLIEVLIASIILFMTLGLVAVVFQQNFATQIQAGKYIASLSDYSSLQAQIRYELEQGRFKGSVTTATAQYNWEAKKLKQAPEILGFSPETGNAETAIGVLTLFNVIVSTDTALTYEFRQTVWQINAD